MIYPDVRRVLDGTSIAHLATVLPDGAPHSIPLGAGTVGERIAFLTGPDSQKARIFRRDPRVALSFTPADNPHEPVVIRGRVVEWLDGDAGWEIVDDTDEVPRPALPTRAGAGRRPHRARAAERGHELAL